LCTTITCATTEKKNCALLVKISHKLIVVGRLL